MNEPRFAIGEAAEASGLTTRTIHYYEQIGLIPRASRGNSEARTGGNRIYSTADIERLRFVRQARMLDLGLGDIADLLILAENGCPSGQPEYRKALNRHLRSIEERIQHLVGLQTVIRHLLARAGASCGENEVRTSCGCMEAPDPSVSASRSASQATDGPSAGCCSGGIKENGKARP